jgi:hypothetical protein
MATIGELLRNAFIKALLPKYDEHITTTDVAKKVKNGQLPNASANGTGKTNSPYAETSGETNKPATLLKQSPNESPSQTNAVSFTVTNAPPTNSFTETNSTPLPQTIVPSPGLPVPIQDETNMLPVPP